MKIHDEIDNYLAADLHSDLSDEEQNALHVHLVECASCRQAHQENKVMNKVLEEKFANEKPDTTFEQRMLAGFRTRVPQRTGGIAKFIVDLMRFRATQVAAVAAVLLALVQVGRMITGEGAIRRNELANSVDLYQRSAATQSSNGRTEADADFKTDQRAKLAKADALQPGRELNNQQRPAKAAQFSDASIAPAAPNSVTGGVAGRMATLAPPAAQPTAEEQQSKDENELHERASTSVPAVAAPPALANRKLIRNATVDLEIVSFDDALQKITAFANEDRGYIATTRSEKQANGKLKGEIVVKVAPENLDRFLQKIRGLGELKNQTLGTEDVTKAYFDTDSRLKNARVMEQRMIDMLKKKSDDINDLLQVEKELGRVREQIEQMQGDLKYWDSQVQFATVTIQLTEKDMEEPAKFLLKERAQLALYAPDVEKVYNDIKALASPKVQITNAQLNRDYAGRVSATMSILIAPEESDGVIGRVKSFGRVENFQTQTDRIAQDGSPAAAGSENARTKRDKVELNITISREEQEQALQQTSLRIRTSSVDKKAKELRALAEKLTGRVRSSTFSRDPDGREFANVSLRVPIKSYPALMQSLNSLGKVENVSVQRQDRTGAQIDEANAPADISIQVYSQGNIISQESGLFATLRRTLAQSAA